MNITSHKHKTQSMEKASCKVGETLKNVAENIYVEKFSEKHKMSK